MEIIEVISHNQESNTYIIQSNTSAVIIDCGAQLEKIDSLINKKVEGVLLTHGHFDHIFELEKYVNKYNCPIYASSKIADKLISPSKNLSDSFCERKVQFASEILDKLICVADEEFTCGDIKIKSITLPGHSACGMGYIVENHLFSGDTLFSSCVGRYDLYDSSFLKLRKSLEKIKSSTTIKTIHPGHGKTFDK